MYNLSYQSRFNNLYQERQSLKPENKIIYDNICENISRNRERAGVHYKSDTDAGYKLGDILFNISLAPFNTSSS